MVLFVQHEPHLATVGDGRDHVDPTLGGIDPNHGRFPFGSKAFGIVGIVLDAGLVTPVNLSLFLLGESLDFWIDRLMPLRNKLGILLVGPFGRFLRGKTPALQIVRNGPEWQIRP